MKRSIRHFPKVQEMLQYASECAVCGHSFLNTWLECVHFVDAHRVSNDGLIRPETQAFVKDV